MKETKLILGINKDIDEQIIKERKADLNKIIKFLLRQTHHCLTTESFEASNLHKMSFYEFLFEVGMFKKNKFFDRYTEDEKAEAEERYLNALTLSVQGTAMVILKREVKHIFVNAYNKLIMSLFKSNHDCQICIDPYAATQYITKYVTKSESGMSLLLKAINDEVTSLNQMDRLNALSNALDKNR